MYFAEIFHLVTEFSVNSVLRQYCAKSSAMETFRELWALDIGTQFCHEIGTKWKPFGYRNRHQLPNRPN